MKVGSLIRFKKTGVLGTILKRREESDGTVTLLVLAHGPRAKNISNPSMFGLVHLRTVAEMIQ